MTQYGTFSIDHAESLGAVVRQETRVDDVKFAPDGVTVRATGSDGQSYEVRSAVFVDATGRKRRNAHALR